MYVAAFAANTGTLYGRYYEREQSTMQKLYVILENYGIVPCLDALIARALQWEQYSMMSDDATNHSELILPVDAEKGLYEFGAIAAKDKKTTLARNKASYNQQGPGGWRTLKFKPGRALQKLHPMMQAGLRKPFIQSARDQQSPVDTGAKLPFFMDVGQFIVDAPKVCGRQRAERLTRKRRSLSVSYYHYYFKLMGYKIR